MRISKNEFNTFPRFALIPEKIYVVDSLCFFVGKDLPYLQGILNSELAAYFFFNNIAILDNGGMQMRQQYVENIPIPMCNSERKKHIEKLVMDINTINNNQRLHKDTNDIVYQIFGFTNEEMSFIKKFVNEKYSEIINLENLL